MPRATSSKVKRPASCAISLWKTTCASASTPTIRPSPCWPVFRKYLGETRPAATAIIAQLIDPRMKIEIQVTGKKR